LAYEKIKMKSITIQQKKMKGIIILCFGSIALMIYFFVFISEIISGLYGYNIISETSKLLFLILASLNTLIVLDIIKLDKS